MAKLSIFLSHSSKDKPFVRRLNKDLKSHGFTTWIDEDNIPFGGSIAKGIQSGLDTCDVLLVFLSEHSTASKWVATEWQSRFFREITDKHIQVVPVLIQKCVIPTFLADKRYIDFQEEGEYERNLSETLAYLSRLSLERYGEPVPVIRREQRILSHVQEILDDLVPEKLAMPLNRRMPIIDTLKKIPRSGKRVRLVDFKPTLKPRSVYDHILSLAHIADCLLPHIETRLKASELGDLSLCIAYHELNEMVLGDIPSYTSLTNEKRNMIRVYAEERVRSVSPGEREEIANRFIWLFLSEKHRQAMSQAMSIFAEKSGHVFPLFRALDKLDPIIAIWRYLHHYRGKLGETPKAFNRQMKDFYENPDIRNFMRDNKIDKRMIELTIVLQDRTNSWNYYEDPRSLDAGGTLFQQIPAAAVRNAIEGVPLFHDEAAKPKPAEGG